MAVIHTYNLLPPLSKDEIFLRKQKEILSKLNSEIRRRIEELDNIGKIYKLGILIKILDDAFIFKNESHKYIHLTISDCEFLGIKYEKNLIISHKKQEYLIK